MLPRTSYNRVLLDNKWAYVRQSGQRQKPPFDLMCAMANNRWRVEFADVMPESRFPSVKAWVSNFYQEAGDSSLEVQATNLAYKRMVDQLGDAASLGALLTAERREAWEMVVSLTLKALLAARYVKKLEFGKAARTLGLSYRERTVVKRKKIRTRRGNVRIIKVKQKKFSWNGGRTYLKTAGSGWLMWSYGVSPLCGDIWTSMDILQSEFPIYRIRGGARLASTKSKRLQANWRKVYSAKIAVSQSLGIRVINPNLYLMNRLGLVNPAQWILEGIPLSFVADWFSNLSDVISSMTDFVGLEVKDPCKNRHMTWVEENYYEGSSSQYARWRTKREDFQRELVVTPPKIAFAYERFQWQRGLNAISLLLQVLK